MYRRLILLMVMITASWTGLTAPARADEPVSVKASLSAGAVYVGDTLIYTIEVENAEPEAQPVVPGGERLGFNVEFIRQQNKSFSSTVIINGKVSQTSVVSHVLHYRIVALRPGQFEIPPVEVKAGGSVLRTEPAAFRAVGPSERDDLRVTLSASTPSPYVGQPFEIEMQVLIAEGASVGSVVFALPGLDERFTPQSSPPVRNRHARASFDFLGSPAEIIHDRVEVDGRRFDRLRAKRTVIASEPGEVSIGPAVWICDFTPPGMRRGARVAVPSGELAIEVHGLPEQGRPRRFSGLVGSYTLSAIASPMKVSVGEPIRFELTLEGPGDLRRVPAPEIGEMPGFDTGFRLANRDTERQYGPGSVTFRYVLRAATDAVEAVPTVLMNYFDPVAGEYAQLETDPIPLEVEPSRIVTAVDGEAPAVAPNEAQRLESAPRTLAANREGPALLGSGGFTLAGAIRSPVVLGLVATPPAAYLALLAMVAVRRRSEQGAQPIGSSPAARRAAAELKRGSVPPAEAIRRAFVRYEALRSAEHVSVVTPGQALSRIRREQPSLATRAEALLSACEAARFGGQTDACTNEHRSEAARLLGELSRAGGSR